MVIYVMLYIYLYIIGFVVSNIVQMAGKNGHIKKEICEWATAKTKHHIDNSILVACDSFYQLLD